MRESDKKITRKEAEDNQEELKKLTEDTLEEMRLELDRMAFLSQENTTAPKAEQKEDVSVFTTGSYVKISEDNMNAWLYLRPLQNMADSYKREDIMEFLEKNGVKCGYHESNISAMIKKKIYEREILAAVGTPCVEGNDGYYEYNFKPTDRKSPQIQPDGSVDYSSMKALQNVRTGDVVAVYHHAEAGTEGEDITGKVLRPANVRELRPLRGQGITNAEDPDVYCAAKDGKIELRDGRIDIQSIHEISGDVDLTYGKIEFYGDILIRGNVSGGVVIRAGRNIEITGIVEASSLFAGGDVIVNSGILGGQKAKISARGNVMADFIEYAVISAGDGVSANSIMNSIVTAEGKVTIHGTRGCIIGGYTHGLQGIEVTNVGNDSELRTLIHTGLELDKYYQGQDIKKREQEIRKQLSDLAGDIENLLRQRRMLGQGLPAIQEEKYRMLVIRKDEISKALKQIEQDRALIEVIREKSQDAKIIVKGNIYRGTVVGVNQLQMPVEHSTCYMSYFAEGGMIVGKVLVYN